MTSSEAIIADSSKTRPLYDQIRSKLKKQIITMSPGHKMPTENQLSEQFSVHRVTIRRAMEELVREGFVVRHRGRGTFVSDNFRRNLSSGSKTKAIALILPSVEIEYFARMLDGIEEEAGRQDINLMTRISRRDPECEKKILRELCNQNVMGVMTVPLHGNAQDCEYAEIINELHRHNKRVIILDMYVPTVETRVAIVDKFQVGYLATEHLIMLGHKKICYASTHLYSPTSFNSFLGYKRALADYKIDFDEKIIISFPSKNCAKPVREAVIEMLTNNPNAFTAIASPQFSMTYGIVEAIEILGLRIPDDIAVVGNDVYNNPALENITHTYQPIREMAQEAVKLLFEDGDNKSCKRHVILQPKLIIRDSCGFQRGMKVINNQQTENRGF